MKKSSSIRLYRIALGLAAVALWAAPASAQYQPRPLNDPATGEMFHIEAFGGFWFPSSAILVSSAGDGALSGIAGSEIDAQKDLGFEDHTFPEIRLVLRPARAHKLRFHYVPIKYEASTTLTRSIVFNGIRYDVNLPVNSSLDWKAYRFAYEYDFIVKNWGFAGFMLEAKYTDVQVELATPLRDPEFANARAPIPSFGGIVRVYVAPNIAITGELSGIRIPRINEKYQAHYADLDLYGTVNLTNNFGFQAGFRSFDLGYLFNEDTGSIEVRGPYFGLLLRY